MKRHQSLYPLSRDHHQALVRAKNLHMAAEADNPAGLQQAAESFLLYWETELRWHFSQEEEFVLPLLASHKTTENHTHKETLKQHLEIMDLIEELQNRLTSSGRIDSPLLRKLSESLRYHIRFEENDLFPALELAATEDELWRMNDHLEQDRSTRRTGSCSIPPDQRVIEE